ncbi:MAG: hypothetical protein ABIP65_08670 [Vicinamibacterales bacterium]
MRTLISAATIAAVILTASCAAKYRFAHLPKKEWIFVAVGMDNGICKVIEQRPGELRTEANSQVHWVIAGSCTGDLKVTIGDFRAKQTPVLQGVIFSASGTKLEGNLPSGGEEATLRLHGRLNANLEKAHYTYEVLIDGLPAQFKSPADRGDMFVCPVWPCGDFR